MDNNIRVLIVEDDKRTAGLLAEYLEQHGYSIDIEYRGDQAEQRVLETVPDLVILDLMLPGMDGLTVCRTIRPYFQGPILILTAREDDMDQVAGLEIGADDYVKKPIDPRVLLARIRALMRRFSVANSGNSVLDKKGVAGHELRFGGLFISLASRCVELDGSTVSLTTSEFDLLWFLAVHEGQVVGRDRIYSELRGVGYDGTDRSIDVRVSQLRKKLGDDSANPRRIITIWGAGYQFVSDAW